MIVLLLFHVRAYFLPCTVALRWFWNELMWLPWKCCHIVFSSNCKRVHFVIKRLLIHQHLAVKSWAEYKDVRNTGCAMLAQSSNLSSSTSTFDTMGENGHLTKALAQTVTCKADSWLLFWTTRKASTACSTSFPRIGEFYTVFLVKSLQELLAAKSKCLPRHFPSSHAPILNTFKALNGWYRNTGTWAKKGSKGPRRIVAQLQNHAIKWRGQGYNSLLKFSFVLS